MSKTNFIAPGAYVLGNVTLKKDANVWFQAVIRGDTDSITVGEGTNIQDNCTLHADRGHPVVLGDYITVGHNAVVHGCTIGDNTVIGMGSIVLSGAVVGANCIVGAGSLVTGMMVIPDGSLVMGSPAHIVRQLTQEEIDSNHENALHYIRLSVKYHEEV